MTEGKPDDVTADHPDGTLLSHFNIRKKPKEDGFGEEPLAAAKPEDAVAEGDDGRVKADDETPTAGAADEQATTFKRSI